MSITIDRCQIFVMWKSILHKQLACKCAPQQQPWRAEVFTDEKASKLDHASEDK
jgi:hypothetical protein